MHATKDNSADQSKTGLAAGDKKPVLAEAAQSIQLNPVWHRLATNTGGRTAAGSSAESKSIQSKALHSLYIQRVCAECEEELAHGPKGIQTKLTVGTPNDEYEQEADAVADKVMRKPVGNGNLGKPHEKTPTVQINSQWQTIARNTTTCDIIQAKGNEPGPEICEIHEWFDADTPGGAKDVSQTSKWHPLYGSAKVWGKYNQEKMQSMIGSKHAKKFAPELKAASEWTYGSGKTQSEGTKISPVELTKNEFSAIMNPGKDTAKEATLTQYLSFINNAFKIMQIDTLEAQSVYLAHAAAETGRLSLLGEKKASGGKQKYVAKLQGAYKGFEGRGPLQVTGREHYLRTLAYIAKRAEQLRDQGDNVSATKLMKVYNAVKSNPALAAHPDNSFIFSAAYMHALSGVKKAAGLRGRVPQFPGNKLEDNWMIGKNLKKALAEAGREGNQGKINYYQSLVDKAKIKRKTYQLAVSVLAHKKVNNSTTSGRTFDRSCLSMDNYK